MKTINCHDCGILLQNVSNRTERCKPCAKAHRKVYMKVYNQDYRQENKETLLAYEKERRDSGYHKQKNIEYSKRDHGCVKGIYKITLDISALNEKVDYLVYIGKCDNTNLYRRKGNHKSNLNKRIPGCPKDFYEKAQELKAIGLNPAELFTFELLLPGDFLTSKELESSEKQLTKMYSWAFPDECVNKDHRWN